jgi:hypothetical protein
LFKPGISNINIDILNCLNPSRQQLPKATPQTYVDPDPQKQLDDARHLAKYVFPRQYDLSSPFGFVTFKKGACEIPDFTTREAAIKV